MNYHYLFNSFFNCALREENAKTDNLASLILLTQARIIIVSIHKTQVIAQSVSRTNLDDWVQAEDGCRVTVVIGQGHLLVLDGKILASCQVSDSNTLFPLDDASCDCINKFTQ